MAAEQRAAARQAAARRAAERAAQASSAAASVSNVTISPNADREATDRLASAAVRSSSASSSGSGDQNAIRTRPISDADFQTTYKRFIEVKTAIEQKDINLITQLADTDGARVQALLQLFSNSESVTASIDKVSSRNTSGTIVGTLTINRVTRRSGSSTRPPENLRSFTLTTRRDAAGWSKIQW